MQVVTSWELHLHITNRFPPVAVVVDVTFLLSLNLIKRSSLCICKEISVYHHILPDVWPNTAHFVKNSNRHLPIYVKIAWTRTKHLLSYGVKVNDKSYRRNKCIPLLKGIDLTANELTGTCIGQKLTSYLSIATGCKDIFELHEIQCVRIAQMERSLNCSSGIWWLPSPYNPNEQELLYK